MSARDLTQFKIPVGTRGRWGEIQDTLIDNLQQIENEISVARGLEGSLGANLDTNFATKEYVNQALIAGPGGDFSALRVTQFTTDEEDKQKLRYVLQIVAADGVLGFTDDLKLGNGIATNPTYGFLTQTSTGMFLNGTTLSFSVGGTARITSSTTAIVLALPTTITGTLAINNSTLNTNQSTFNLVNSTATTVNFAGAATTLTIGATSGDTTIRNNLEVSGLVTRGGNTVWDAGNDGPGSGLDADLLDGQQGSFYQNASNLNAGTIANARTTGTNLNTANTLVLRDASGNFSAGIITAALSGNATTATTLQTARTISLTGDVTGSVSFNGGANVSITTTIQPNSVALGTDTVGNYASSVDVSGNGLSISGTPGEGTDYVINSNATDLNTASTLVFRNASGNFSAGTITAALSGNATTATTLQTARTINGVSFNGSANISIPTVRGTNGTVVINTTGVTSGVNFLQVTNSIAGSPVTLSTGGADTNIGLNITTKGTGAIVIDTGTGAGQIDLKPGASNVRFWDDDSSHYYQLVTGNNTANYNITLPAGDVVLSSGTTVSTTRQINTNNGLTGGGDLSADRTLGLTGQALALHNLATNGFIVRTGAGTVASRSLVAGAGISITNVDGVAGNPTITNTGVLSLIGSGGITVSASTGNITLGSTATSANTPNAIVSRDANGDFSARHISASKILTGTIDSAARVNFLNNTAAVGINIGSLLVSGAYADASLVPSLGAYIKGNILTPANITSESLNTTGNAVIGGSLEVTGDLTVNGTLTTVNSTQVTVDDPVITLGGDVAPTVDDNKDRGVEFRWHTGAASRVGFFGFDDSTGYFTFIPNATNTNEVFSGTLGDMQAANFRGALIGNATTATTLQTARTISLSGDVVGSVSFNGSANVTIATTIQPNSVALGTDTVGNYAGSVDVSGNGLSITGTAGEGTDFVVNSNATDLNTASTLVFRNASGNFSAGTITAALAGNATTATTLQTARTISLTGDVTGSVSFNGGANVSITATVANDSHTHDGRYYTETEADNRFLQLAGGTLTGTLESTKTNSAVTGAGQIYLNGTNGNRIDWNIEGLGGPAFTTRSAGTKLVLYPGVAAAAVDMGMGVDTNTLWTSVRDAADSFRWYAGTTQVGLLTGAGALTVSSVDATTFTGNLIGNATTATRLQTARTINGVSFNGTANITITANTTQTLTRGAFLTGANFNGSTATTWAVDATTTNTANKVVARDASGNFAAGTITANLTGNATTATTATNLSGGSVNATTGAFSGNITRAGNVVWDAGNDGSGSGLDADLLDGFQASQTPLPNTIPVRNADGTLNIGAGRQSLAFMKFTSNGSFIIPTGVTQVRIQAQGAGGAGAPGTTAGQGYGEGGAAGGYVEGWFDVTPGDTLTITVGVGGTAPIASIAEPVGGNGTNTTISGSGVNIVANGGLGGRLRTSMLDRQDVNFLLNAQEGGAATGGDVNLRGGDGIPSYYLYAADYSASTAIGPIFMEEYNGAAPVLGAGNIVEGIGGNSFFATWGKPQIRAASSNGRNAPGYGAGGGGATDIISGTGYTGGTGGAGLVIIEY